AAKRMPSNYEKTEPEFGALDGALKSADDAVSGIVRITSVPIIVNHILVPAADSLLQRHPKLQLELVADPRDLSLTRRETDLALRLARPKSGGTKVMASRIGTIRYDVYASASCYRREAQTL